MVCARTPSAVCTYRKDSTCCGLGNKPSHITRTPTCSSPRCVCACSTIYLAISSRLSLLPGPSHSSCSWTPPSRLDPESPCLCPVAPANPDPQNTQALLADATSACCLEKPTNQHHAHRALPLASLKCVSVFAVGFRSQ